jgi:hypothetical protein
VWQREITYIEDPAIADVALGGADTATRTQTVWQVRVEAVDNAVCGLDVGEPPSAGRLTTQALAPPEPDDPCLLAPQSGYRGLENRLYRVEVHDGGPLGTARFKWSRDNGSIVSPVTAMAVSGAQTTLTLTRIGRDPVLRFRIDDWVTVTDDHRELHGERGEMARVIDLDETQGQIVLDRALPSPGARAFGANAGELAERHTRVQRWDQTLATNAIDADGLIATAAGPIDLEDGVQVAFSADPAGGSFRTGDYWVFAARTADASVEILTEAPPRGIEHHYVQLAAITGLGGEEPDVTNCRPGPEEPHEGCCCCLVTVRPRGPNEPDAGAAAGGFTSLAGAVAALPSLAPDPDVHVIICLLEGDHHVPSVVRVTRPRVTIRGCGWGSRLIGGREGVLRLEGAEQAVETLAIVAENDAPLIHVTGSSIRIEGCHLENQGPGAAILAERRIAGLIIRGNVVRGTGGLDLAANAVLVDGNRLLRAGILIRRGSQRVRIRDNDLIAAFSDAITLGDGGVVYDIDVEGNRVHGARGSGIASAGFDPGENGERDGIILDLQVTANDIVGCVDDAGRTEGGVPRGGIVLGRVYNLIARDNRIEGNGTRSTGPICGIFVRHSRGVEISRNVIRANGRPPGGARSQGPQAGISLRDASVLVTTAPDEGESQVAVVDILPAARIADNFVESPRGPALYVRGQGPMVVAGNRFQAVDILGDLTDGTFGTVDQYIGTVFLMNTGRPAYLSAYLAGAGVPALGSAAPTLAAGTPVLEALIVGGQTQFSGNQARLDLARRDAEVALANVAILSLDDVGIVNNQTEVILSGAIGEGRRDRLLSDLLNFGLTTRQMHNGLMATPILTSYSIVSRGVVNHCIANHTTSCISALGTSPQSVERDNVILFPNPAFCGRG